MTPSSQKLPLFALLSQALVAFTVEFDNEFEHRAPHRTSRHGSPARSSSGPWAVSMVFWLNFIRFIPEEGISIRDWKRATGLTPAEVRRWLTRLSKWWGIVAIEKGAAESPAHWILRPTAGGRSGIAVWRPLAGIIEARWDERFGQETMANLRVSLAAVAAKLNPDLPDHLPILGYPLLTELRPALRPATNSLPALLAKLLLAFSIEFEAEADQSLAIAANALRVLGDGDVPLRDLPRLSGVSKEAIAMAAKRLQKRGWATLEAPPFGHRSKVLALTAEGKDALLRFQRVAKDIEDRWTADYGQSLMDLRSALERLAGDGLFRALTPYPDNWRASNPAPEVLPHYPMILHRGGYPDGS